MKKILHEFWERAVKRRKIISDVTSAIFVLEVKTAYIELI